MQELNKLNETLFYQTQNKKKKSNMQNIKKKIIPGKKRERKLKDSMLGF